MKKILITGAGGFIGRSLLEQLSSEYNILPVTRKEVDLLEQKQVETMFFHEDIDVVIHAATQNTLGRGKESEEQLLKNNLRMFLNLERCKSYYGKMFLIGSGAEYGKQQELSLVEEGMFGEKVPEDDYGLSKYIMSKISGSSDNIYNLRLFGIFGPYENYNYRFISNVICKALSGRDIVIHQNALFDYLYIKDFCDIMRWFLEHEPKWKYYNICTGKRTELVSVAREVLAQTGSKSLLAVEQPGLNKEYTGSNTRMLQETGEMDFTPIEQSIGEMIEYFQNIAFCLEGNY